MWDVFSHRVIIHRGTSKFPHANSPTMYFTCWFNWFPYYFLAKRLYFVALVFHRSCARSVVFLWDNPHKMLPHPRDTRIHLFPHPTPPTTKRIRAFLLSYYQLNWCKEKANRLHGNSDHQSHLLCDSANTMHWHPWRPLPPLGPLLLFFMYF